MKQPSVCHYIGRTPSSCSRYSRWNGFTTAAKAASRPAEFEYLSFCPVLIAAYVSLALYLALLLHILYKRNSIAKAE